MELRVYEVLLQLNRGMDQALESLDIVEKLELGPAEGASRVRTDLRQVRSCANNHFASKIAQKEQEEENNFYRVRRNREKAEEAPNEIHRELKSPEELRRQQRLPPRSVILPWTQADGDRVLTTQNAASSPFPVQPEQPRITGNSEQKNQKEVRRHETNCLRIARPTRPQPSRIRQPFQEAC